MLVVFVRVPLSFYNVFRNAVVFEVCGRSRNSRSGSKSSSSGNASFSFLVVFNNNYE